MRQSSLTALATRLGARLRAREMTLATAESCTGGWVAQTVTSVSGSSQWFDRGFVTYSNHAKREMLGVDAATLAGHGAVSEQTARAMATGALDRSRAGVAVAITGIAGPTGGAADKPAGTVCFAWALRAGAVDAETRFFAGDREAVRRQSVVHALQGLLDRLEA